MATGSGLDYSHMEDSQKNEILKIAQTTIENITRLTNIVERSGNNDLQVSSGNLPLTNMAASSSSSSNNSSTIAKPKICL